MWIYGRRGVDLVAMKWLFLKNWWKDIRILFIWRVVSLSIDKNEKAWLARAPEDRPGWKQYQATELSQRILEEEYHITAIPRFMLLDRNGKIIDAHAPRPSDDIIHQLIHRFLTSRAMVQGNFSLVLDNTY